ncbi:MAG: hypothetical protein HOV94_24505 [Saccharothrix sp.]|nr:hypothetical protein [Saccharothrix sp.]
MIERVSHRVPPRVLRIAVALVAAVLALPLVATAARAQDAVVGRWDTTVRSAGKPPTRVVLVFHADYRVEIQGQVGIGGVPAYVGGGGWQATSATTISFDVTHPLTSPEGAPLGVVRSHQEGTVAADRFSTTGETYLDQPDGTTTGPYPTTMDGTRARR